MHQTDSVSRKFPFPIDSPQFEMRMNATPCGGESRVDVDEALFAAEVRLRRDISATARDEVHACPESECEAAWEAVEVLLTDAALHFPQHCVYRRHGDERIWGCSLVGDDAAFRYGDLSSLPQWASSPLDLVGLSLQEDVVLMRSAGPTDAPAVTAGHVCFASGWSLGGKLGSDIDTVHAPVPGYADTIGTPCDLLLRRLKPERPVMRWNWTIADGDELDRSPAAQQRRAPSRRDITPGSAGENCFFRVERQTLTRLPSSRAVLFTIHTYVTGIGAICTDPDRRRLLLGNLETMPAQTVAYKSAQRYLSALLQYLRGSSS